MTSFTDEQLEMIADDTLGVYRASTLARELLQLRQQITPQAGEAEPVAWRSVDNTGDYIYSASDTIGGEPLYTALPPPVCPHIRSSDEGTQWCDLAAKPGAPVWQPIETAPRDGTIILLHQSGHIERGCWDFIENNDCDGTPVYGWTCDWGNCHDPDGWLPSDVLPPDSPGAD